MSSVRWEKEYPNYGRCFPKWNSVLHLTPYRRLIHFKKNLRIMGGIPSRVSPVLYLQVADDLADLLDVG